MKIIQPHKISGEILDIIYEARQFLILVSPYVDFEKWKRLESELINAKNRGVRIDFFVRNEPENSISWEQIEGIGLIPRLVNNLHAKFYFNEKAGVISSMNLLYTSNTNSIEIGSKLEGIDELEELKKFVKDFITPNEVKEKPSNEDLYLTKEKFIIALENYLTINTKYRTNIFYKNGSFNINAISNNFYLHIDKVENIIIINGILSQNEADEFNKNSSKYFKSSYFKYQLIPGNGKNYNQICAESCVRLSNSYLDNLRVIEKKQLICEIYEFINGVKKLKTLVGTHEI